MGLLNQANKFLENPPGRKGLLRCSIEYKQGEIHQGQGDNLSGLLDDYKENIGNIKSDVDLVNYVTAIFVKYLHIEKIAWFMFDPVSDSFISWITIGISNESRKKLLFPREVLNQIITTSFLMEVPANNIDQYKKYFDPADYKTISSLVFLPLFLRTRLLGFLLIANLNGAYTTNKELDNLFSKSPAAVKIMEERLAKITALAKYSISMTDDLSGELEKQLEYAVKNHTIFKIMKLNLESVIDPVMEDDPKLNPLILKEDILLLFGQLFKHIGYIYNIKNGFLLFTVNKLRKLDIDILKDQLVKTMKSYFSEIMKTNNFNLAFKLFSYPEDGESIETLLSVIL